MDHDIKINIHITKNNCTISLDSSSVILCFFSIIIIGCESKKPVEDLVIHRFENEFYNSNEENLKLLVNKYPYLFPEQYSMETWKSFLKDSTRLRIYDKSSRIFNNFEVISKEILEVFIKLEGIFPEFKRPKVITLNNQSEFYHIRHENSSKFLHSISCNPLIYLWTEKKETSKKTRRSLSCIQ